MLNNLCMALLMCTGVATVCAMDMDNDVPMSVDYPAIPAPGSPANRRGIWQRETPPPIAPKPVSRVAPTSEVLSFECLVRLLGAACQRLREPEQYDAVRLASAKNVSDCICRLTTNYSHLLTDQDRADLYSLHRDAWQVISMLNNSETED